jgi:glycosyltransferase involved in cell wall biosynthesis
MNRNSNIRLLFFIGSLKSGGKERRLIELLSYLKNLGLFDLKLILTYNQVEYETFNEIGINYISLDNQPNDKKCNRFFTLYKICKEFKPDIIHTWGRMQTFYTIPTILLTGIPLVNSQITNAPPSNTTSFFSKIINKINFFFSSVIISNSYAGLNAYRLNNSKKTKVIYNGVNLNRFINPPKIDHIKNKYKIQTKYAVIMAASFSQNKNYDLFLKIAEITTAKRNDVSFIAVGGSTNNDIKFNDIKKRYESNNKIILPGKINDVEALINICDVGLLFSQKERHGEGLSNSIIEYMALGKPVIANDAGGTSEILKDKHNGFLVLEEDPNLISDLIIRLIDNKVERENMGKIGKVFVENNLNILEIGKIYSSVYIDLLPNIS